MSMPRPTRPIVLVACALVLAVGLTVAAGVLLSTTSPTEGSAAVAPAAAGRDITDPAALVASLQARLTAHPRDAQGWAGLGFAYVEQARITADPTYYPKADRALAKAARLAPGSPLTLTGLASLAAARHDFSRALRLADQAIAKDPYSAQAFATRADALTELGRYDEARRSAVKADDLRPGSSTFARLSYAAELRGDLAEATRLMAMAQDSADSASSFAFAAFHLGELSRAAGRTRAAAAHYAAALDADPTYAPALAGRARLEVARGDLAAAERDYLTVVQRLPLTEYVVELGELYAATGRPELARQQWAVAHASAALAQANGVVTDLETALFEADHGSPAAAVVAARAEWRRRRSIHVADALGWALHAAGRDRQALRYATLATRLGTKDARLVFHRGAIEAALGRVADARTQLDEALRLDGGVSPFRDGQARRLLTSLGAGR
ncbi:MAG: tetratricopeptide repeat protein [Actinomycetes bacterium]